MVAEIADERPELVIGTELVAALPAAALRAAASVAALLVVGADTAGSFAETVSGSIPGELLTTASCPQRTCRRGRSTRRWWRGGRLSETTPSAALLRNAADAGLVVVGTRGRGGFRACCSAPPVSTCSTTHPAPSAVVRTGADGCRHARASQWPTWLWSGTGGGPWPEPEPEPRPRAPGV